MAELGIGQAVLKKKGAKKSKVETHLPEFRELAINNYIYTQPRDKGASARRSPLVVLCTWMGADPKHIAKYVAEYKRRIPDVGVLLITSEPADMLVRSFDTQQRTLTHARNILRSAMNLHGDEEAASPVLLHVFSHGGCNSAIQLVTSFKRFKTVPPLEFDALVLDSGPGGASFERSVKAMSVSLPKNVIKRFFLLISAYVALAFAYVMVFLGLRSGIDHMRKELIDPSLFPRETKRLYVYSKADEMVDYKEVRRHAEEAEAAGYSVKSVVFENSAHCGHIREDEDRYWDAVKNVWPKAVE